MSKITELIWKCHTMTQRMSEQRGQFETNRFVNVFTGRQESNFVKQDLDTTGKTSKPF